MLSRSDSDGRLRAWTPLHPFLLAVTALLAWSAWKAPALVEATCHEGQCVELLTALGYAVAAVLFAASGQTLDGPLARAWKWSLALLCAFVAAEELSWGQSLFHWPTPEALREVNVQSETNLHNVVGLHGVIRLLGVAVVGFVFFVVPWAARRWRSLGNLLSGLLAPPTAASTAALAVAIMLATRLVAGGPVFELDEWAECVLAIAFLEYGLAGHGHRRRHTARIAEGARKPDSAR